MAYSYLKFEFNDSERTLSYPRNNPIPRIGETIDFTYNTYEPDNSNEYEISGKIADIKYKFNSEMEHLEIVIIVSDTTITKI